MSSYPMAPSVEAFLGSAVHVAASDEQRDRIRQFYSDLVEANKQTNLTRITDWHDFCIRHVADSLSILRIIPELSAADAASLQIADVGCGAGIPMIPLLCMDPDWQIAGIESRGRKAAFVRRELQRFGFANASCVHARAREQARLPGWKERFDLVLLRAVSSAAENLRECRHLLRKEAALVCYKTPESVRQEYSTAAREADKFGFAVTCSDPFELPEQQGERQFLLFRR